jgi:hypothetical protein
VTRLLVAAACFAAAVSLALPAVRSDARFNSRSADPHRIAADQPVNYLRLYSQSSDPGGLTGYATKRLSNPLVPAATGDDGTLAVELGAYKNDKGTTVNRVLTLEAVNPLPAGASPLNVTATLAPDPVTGRQPVGQVTFSDTNGANAAATATLTAGVKKQLNLRVTTQGFPGNGVLHLPTVTHPGYAGAFLDYPVKVSVWDGNGAGP